MDNFFGIVFCNVYDVFELFGDTYSFEPYNLELSEPATISILYNENLRSGFSIVKLDDENDETWERVNTSNCSNGECVANISSFGLYSVARIVDDSYYESCFAHPLEENYNSFTFVGIEDSDNSQLQSSPEMYSLSFKETQDVVSIVGREIQLTKDYTTGNATFKQGSRGTVIEVPSRKDGKLKVKLDNDNEKTFRLIKECDLQLYEGGPLSFSSESQTEETSFEY